MANLEKMFNVKVDAGGQKMSCSVKASSPGKLVENATERFGIQLTEIHELTIKSGTINICIVPQQDGK
ncbi:hypothetical protein LCGC14_2177140 [marine sediment metagenome]|uniref:Uncharacterized protein n=1 Tax=marine sediment metagenome TaxID=412755 RepID=A0A0F9EAK7_9ZZZZ